MSTILAVRKQLPPYRHTRQEMADALTRLMGLRPGMADVLRRLFENTTIQTRHTALPTEDYFTLDGFTDANARHFDAVRDYGAQAVAAALDTAGTAAADVDLLITQSVTGVAVPPVDVPIIDRLGLRPDIDRMPLFGFGCGGGGAALARMHDYLRAWPDRIAVLLSAELCSLTVQPHLHTVENILGTVLCGDALAAVVACGADRAAALGVAGPTIEATRCRLYPNTAHMAGWQVGAHGLRLILHPDLPEEFAAHIQDEVAAFLAAHGLATADVRAWPTHPGGPKILDGVAKALGLPEDALALSRAHLASAGNCSSVSVLHVLADTIAADPPAGSPGLLMSFGPGLFSQLVLLRW